MSYSAHKKASLILLMSLLVIGIICDCPITRYRPQIRTGQVKVTQSQLTQGQSVQSTHIHPLDTPLAKPNPTVIIGLTGYSYTRSGTNVEFQIVYLSNIDLTKLSFQVRSIGAFEAQRIFSFKFLAIDRDFTEIQTGIHKGHPILNPIPTNFALLSPSLVLNTQIAIFLNGFKGTNLPNTWNLQLSSPRLQSGQLKYDLVSNLASSQIQTITYSYMLYNRAELFAHSEVLLQPLQFSSGNSMRVRFNSLQYTDLTFFGLSSISFAPNLVHSIDILLDDKSSTDVGLMIDSNLNGLPFQVFIWQSFVKQPFVCSFCKDGSLLYEQRFCVSQCPGDSVPQQGIFLMECKKCSIEELRVLDPVNRRCVCAVQHFDRLGVCTACHYTCLTCVSESNMDCLTCDVSSREKLTFRQLIKQNSNSLTGRCACPSIGFYEQDSNIRCIACHPDCRTCSGAADTECLECNRQRTKNELGMCVCKTGYTSQTDGSCACINPRYQVSGSCINPLNSCGLNEVEVVQNIRNNNGNGNNGNDNNGRNNNRNTPATQTTTTTRTCQCRQGFARVKGECLPCGPNEQYNSKKGICQCVKQAVKHKSQGCIVCSPDKRYDRSTQTCICKNKNQFLDKKGNCISCPQKSVFYQDQCYCINNYFMNSKGKCQKCNKKSDSPTCKRYGEQTQ